MRPRSADHRSHPTCPRTGDVRRGQQGLQRDPRRVEDHQQGLCLCEQKAILPYKRRSLEVVQLRPRQMHRAGGVPHQTLGRPPALWWPNPGKASCTGHCAWGPANVTSGEALYCDAKLKAEEVALGATSCFIAVPMFLVMAFIFLKDWIGGLECCAACGGGDCGGGDCGSCCASSKQWERTAPKARHVTAHGRCPRARRLRIAPQPTTYPPHASLPPPRPSPSVRQAADFSPGAR